MNKPELTTARTRMRPLTSDDVDLVHKLWTDAAVRKFLWDDVVIDRERAAQVVDMSGRDFAAHGFGLWLIQLQGSGQTIGFCGLRESEHGAPELLYGLWPQWWGQGFATEAARAVLAYALGILGHAVIAAATDVPNLASIRVLTRLGMTCTGRGDLNGLDTLFYEMTRETFAASL